MTKRFFALLMAVVMVLALSVPAFAEDPAPSYSITVTNQNEDNISIVGNTYSAYKLFDVVYNVDSEGKASGHAYTIKSTSPFYTDKNAKAELDKYFTFTPSAADPTVVSVVPKTDNDNNSIFTADKARALADALEPMLKTLTADGSTEAASESVTISVPAAGYYLIAGTAKPTEDGTTPDTIVAAVALDTTNPAAAVNVKADAPKIDKDITTADSNNGGLGKGTAQDVGSSVPFTVTSKVPDMTGSTAYTFVVSDTMTEGLTFNNDVTITIGDTELTSGTDYIVKTENIKSKTFEIEFKDFINYADQTGDDIVITYSATINEKALITDVEENTVDLTYDNKPEDSQGPNTTPPHKVYVYDFDIVIDKFDGQDEAKKLEGAEFVVYKVEDSKTVYYVNSDNTVTWDESIDNATKVVTDENGAASFTGVDSGVYYLHETAAPAGYNPLPNDVKVEITAEYDIDGTLKSTNTIKEDNGQYKITAKIENNTGVELPETGGIGTTIFYVVGAVLVVGAAVILFAKKKVEE